MTALRNPLLFVICLMLLANLVFNGPRRAGSPHGPRANVDAGGSRPAASLGFVASDRTEPDVEYGEMLFGSNCAACHGSRGHGVPRMGANLRESAFVRDHDDAQLVTFLKQGRAPADPSSLMGMLMPARGGNGSLDELAMRDIIAFIRECQDDARRQQAPGDSKTADTSAHEDRN
jgi:mono/diheme cytochrome c family protein